jgi:predicted glutamine amidotransferase
MCRWMAYKGTEVFLDELLFKTEYSLIQQSRDARRSDSRTNGDGFGLAWYKNRDLPGLYRAIRPAWNDDNLHDLAKQISCSVFLAHVRAATGSEIQRSNCHPFRHGKWCFVHNGLIQHFEMIRRRLMLEVKPELFNHIRGTTDSELMFFLAAGFGLEQDPLGAFELMTGLVEYLAEENAIANAMQMTVGLSNGHDLYAIRYSTKKDSRSLFHSKSRDALQELNPMAARFDKHSVAVVSEPFTHLDDYWEEIPESSAIRITDGHIEHRAFTPRMPELVH